MYVCLLVGVSLELGKVVNRAQQPCSDETLPATPALEGTGILDRHSMICIYRGISMFVKGEILPWDECDDGVLDCLRV